MADLRDNWERFGMRLEDIGVQKGMNHVDAYDLGQKYAKHFQELWEKYDFGEIDKDMLYDEWYEMYDDLIGKYNIDLHEDYGNSPQAE